jgi:tetratricopeptide (TPR) repeat protein
MIEVIRSREDSSRRVFELCGAGAYDAAMVVAATAVATLDARREAGAEVDGLQLATALRSLAAVHECLGQHDEAAECADRAIALWHEAEQQDEPQLGMVMHTRATSHLVAGEFDEALPLLERAVSILENAGELFAQDFMAVLLTMAELSSHHGEFARSRALYARVLDMLADVEPASQEHAATTNGMSARALFGLGSSFAQAGQADQAVDYLSRSIELFEAGFGIEHPEVLSAKQAIAAIYRVIGQTEAADALESELDAVERHDEVGAEEMDVVVRFDDNEN